MIDWNEIGLNNTDKTLIHFTNSLYQNNHLSLIEKEEIRDMLSSGQLISKKWLLDILDNYVLKSQFPTNDNVKIIVAGGWCGFLASLIGNTFKNVIVDTCDNDPRCHQIAEGVLSAARGTSFCQNMMDVNYSNYNVIINTSSEHLDNISKWSQKIAPNKFVIVQGNNLSSISGHISCVNSEDELCEQLNLSSVLYKERIVFPFYSRFMVVGIK